MVCVIGGIYNGLNSLRPGLNRRPYAGDIFKCIFLNENEWILPRISLKFVPRVRINNIPALVQIMAWRRPGDKPLSEPMMVSLLTHICVTRPQWVKTVFVLVMLLPLKLRWSRGYCNTSYYHHHEIGRINIFLNPFHGFVSWVSCTIILCQLFHPGTSGFLFPLLLAVVG